MTQGVGLGLRTGHFNHLLKTPRTKIDWFEAITENFINTEGAPLAVLAKLRETYPIALHGVALSIGSVDGVRLPHLKKIKRLAERIEPFQISDHLCFARFSSRQYHELLPLPLTFAMAKRVIANIDKVQTFLGRPLVLENISAYASFPQNEMAETEFLNFIADASGCKLLLDINNIYVNAANFRFNARRFLLGIDPRHVAQYHLAGFSDLGTHLFDTHAEKIHNPVLRLFREAKHHIGERPLSLERDDRIPAFQVLEREILRTAALTAVSMPGKFSAGASPQYPAGGKAGDNLRREKLWQKTLYTRVPTKAEKSAGTLTPRAVQKVYRNAYEIRLTGALQEKFIRLAQAMPRAAFLNLCKKYVAAAASTEEDLGEYGATMPRFVAKQMPQHRYLPDLARLDLMRYKLHQLAPGAQLTQPFAKKVSLTQAIRLWHGETGPRRGKSAPGNYLALYRDHYAVKELLLQKAEFDFLRSLQKPVFLLKRLAVAEKEKRLSAAAVKRLFRILGLPGILA